MEPSPKKNAVADAEAYYDSEDADRFYYEVWGGEDIHVGLYESPQTPIKEASHRTLAAMAEMLGGVDAGTRVLDVGAGYGGAGRFLAKKFDCHVTCLNLSEVQNERNRQFNRKAGLLDRVDVVQGNFEDLPFPAASFDLVWSQDAILHSGRRAQVLSEVDRVSRSGSRFIFTDPMQTDDCPEGVLQPVLDRIHLETLGSVAFYRKELRALGWREDRVELLTEHLGRHYESVRANLEGRRGELEKSISPAYIEKMLTGLDHWVNAQAAGHLAWGILLFSKP